MVEKPNRKSRGREITLNNSQRGKLNMLDTSKIDGYENMTAEEKVIALESLEMPKVDDDEVVKLRNALNKASSETAEWKRQYKQKLTDEERRQAEEQEKEVARLENENAMKERIAQLESEKAISKNKAEFLALGYDDELATASAEAMVKGDTQTLFANQKVFNDRLEAQHKASLLENQPSLTNGNSPTAKTITRAEIMAIKSASERQKLIAENIELFR